MTFLHFRYKERLGLLASQSLSFAEAEEMKQHLATCDSCRDELAELAHVSSLLKADAVAERPLPISSDALRTRVLARIRTAPQARAPRPVWGFAPAFTSIGLVVMGVLSGVLLTRIFPTSEGRVSSEPSVQTATMSDTGETVANNDAFYARLEQSQARANAVQYLAEAQDVLIQVTSAADCPDSPKDSVDVMHEAQTSRLLLKRRAALVSGTEDTLVAARGVLEEVEGVLQQVAELEQCTRRSDVDAIARKVDRKKLLMKIDLVAQELAAP